MAQPAPFMPAPQDFHAPPITDNGRGALRSVGVEIEFIGPTAIACAEALAREFGGTVTEDDPHAFRLVGSSFGDISVELDARYVHPEKTRGMAVLGHLPPRVASWLGSAASLIVPCELVTGPVPLDRLHEVDRIVDVLRELGAKGTQDGALYAFGLHFNPEAPRLDVGTIRAILTAFTLLNGWLRRQVAPDPTREFMGFADPFPEDYVRRLADAAYDPDLPDFIDEYLAANPTRNRDLDLLPLLLHLDEARVRAVLPTEKIGGRPTFHYRLPDARVSDPGWSIAPDWNRWVMVERVAGDPERLGALRRAYLAYPGEAKSWADLAERIAFA